MPRRGRLRPAQGSESSLVPFVDKRFVELFPFTLEPDRRRRKPFLPEGVDCHHVVAARRFAGGRVRVGGGKERVLSQSRNKIFVVTAIHAVDTITLEGFFRIRPPLEMASCADFFAEQPLRRGWKRKEGRGR